MKPGKILLTAVILSLSAASGGCSIMSKEECLSADWESRGLGDGTEGKASSLLSEYHKACDEYRPVDDEAYRRGRGRGAKIYCVPKTLFNTGMSGAELTDICNDLPEHGELMVYYQRGQIAYLAERQVSWFDDLIQKADSLLGRSRWFSKSYRIRGMRDTLAAGRAKARTAADQAAAGMNEDVSVPDLRPEMESTGIPEQISRYADADLTLDRLENEINNTTTRIMHYELCINDDDKDKAESCRREYYYYRDQKRELESEYRSVEWSVGL